MKLACSVQTSSLVEKGKDKGVNLNLIPDFSTILQISVWFYKIFSLVIHFVKVIHFSPFTFYF